MHQKNIFIKNRQGIELSLRLTFPPNATRLVFLQHGFSGNKNEPHILITEEELANNRYIVVNIDASNSLNDSGASIIGPTFTSHYQDLADVILWAKEQSWYQQPFTLAGHSMGAASCLYYAENFPEQVSLLLLLSFPWLSGQSKIAQENPEKLHHWQTEGYWDKVSKHSGKILHVPYHYIEDLLGYDFGLQAANITAKTIMVIGDRENTIRLEDNHRLYESLTCDKEFILLPQTPHCPAGSPETAATFKKALQQAFAAYW